MLSWEYPPKIVGGIARHVHELSRALAANGVRVDVVTCEHPEAPPEELDGNLCVHRVPVAPGNDRLPRVVRADRQLPRQGR